MCRLLSQSSGSPSLPRLGSTLLLLSNLGLAVILVGMVMQLAALCAADGNKPSSNTVYHYPVFHALMYHGDPVISWHLRGLLTGSAGQHPWSWIEARQGPPAEEISHRWPERLAPAWSGDGTKLHPRYVVAVAHTSVAQSLADALKQEREGAVEAIVDSAPLSFSEAPDRYWAAFIPLVCLSHNHPLTSEPS